MSDVFSSITTFGCEGSIFPSIPFAHLSIVTSPVPDPIIHGDIFSFPLPIPITPIGCACIPAAVNVTGFSTQPLFASAQFIPTNGDCCELAFQLSLNIPPTAGLPPICGPGDLDFDLVTNPAVKGQQFGITGSFASGDPCTFDLNLGLTFDCPVFPSSAIFASITRPNQYRNSVRLAISSLSLPVDECAFGIDLGIDLPCIVPRLGARAKFNTSLSQPLAVVRYQTPPGTESTPVNATGTVGGVVAGGSKTRFQVAIGSGSFTTETTFPPNYFVNCVLTFTSGVNNGQSRVIDSYGQGWNWPTPSAIPSTGFTFLTAFTNNIENGATFSIACGGPITQAGQLPINECDRLWTIELEIPPIVSGGQLPDLEVRSGYVLANGTPGTGEYSVVFMETPEMTPFVAYNWVEFTNSVNLQHPQIIGSGVTGGDPVPVSLFGPDANGTWFFHHYVEPLDEECTPPAGQIISPTSIRRKRVRLYSYPSGLLKCTSTGINMTYEILCPDLYGLGWLPVSSVPSPYAAWAYPGAKFWYNIIQHPLIDGHFLFALLDAAATHDISTVYVEVDGIVAASLHYDDVNLVWQGDDDPLIVINRYGLWWMKDTFGNVPWYDGAYMSDCQYSYYACPPDSPPSEQTPYSSQYGQAAIQPVAGKRIILSLDYNTYDL